MSNLPEEILEEIFLRLPKKSLLRFRCVNKSFCALFDSRRFQGMHHELCNIGSTYMLYEAKRNQKYWIDYESVSSLLPLSTSSTTIFDCRHIVNRMDYPSIFRNFDKVECLFRIKGLNCIHTTKSSGEEFYIWNSTTNACQKIPMAREVNHYNIQSYGFDYDYRTNDYKLVRIVYNSDSKCSDVDVYASGSNLWKSTQSIPYYLYEGSKYGDSFEGGIHWLVRTFEQGSIKMICFNVTNEIFQEMALPEEPLPYLEEPLEENLLDMQVVGFGGCLCLFYSVVNVRVDIWMMQEYGVKESWAKSFSIAQESILTSNYFSYFIWTFKNNESLWEIDEDLILYDPNNKTYRKLVLDSVFAECISVTENSMDSLSLNK